MRSITSNVDETGTRLASGTLSPVWELFRISNVFIAKENLVAIWKERCYIESVHHWTILDHNIV